MLLKPCRINVQIFPIIMFLGLNRMNFCDAHMGSPLNVENNWGVEVKNYCLYKKPLCD